MVANDPRFSGPEVISGPARSTVASDVRPAYAPKGEVRTDTEIVAAGSSIAALGGAGAAALAIIALAGIIPEYLGPVAAIVLGGAFLAEGGAVASRYTHLIESTQGDPQYAKLSLGGGMGTDMLGGAAGVTLGILALVGLVPTILMACAVIALGATALLSAGTNMRLNQFAIGFSGAHPKAQEFARESVNATADAQALVGVGAIVLGILALIGIAPVTLYLVGLLALGGGLLLGSSALAGRMMGIFAR